MSEERLRLARARAISKAPYYEALLMRLELIERPEVGRLAADAWGRLYFNPEYTAEANFDELTAVFLLQLEHLLRGHALRRRGFNSFVWGLASIIAVTKDLEAQKFSLPEGWLRASDFALTNGLSTEQCAIRLAQLPLAMLPYGEGLIEQFSLKDGLEDLPGELVFSEAFPFTGIPGSAAHGVPQKWEDEPPPLGDSPFGEGLDFLLREELRDEMLESGAFPGESSDWRRRRADLRSVSNTPWQALLRREIRRVSEAIVGGGRATYKRRSRRQSAMPPHIRLPAYQMPQGRLALVVDTSGSMGTKELEAALAEIDGILKGGFTFLGATVLATDAAVKTVQKVHSARSVQLIGGGGTNMGLGIAAAHQLRPKPEGIVVVTDGQTYWPKERPQIPTIICLVRKPYSGYALPEWGTVVRAYE